jgi:hypothetical protein
MKMSHQRIKEEREGSSSRAGRVDLVGGVP